MPTYRGLTCPKRIWKKLILAALCFRGVNLTEANLLCAQVEQVSWDGALVAGGLR